MENFGLLGKFTAREENRDMLAAILIEAASQMEAVEGCQLYTINLPETELDSVYVYEVWSSKAAHEASLSLEGVQTLINQAKPLITGMERIESFKQVWGKGTFR
ncbi:putative quinol monooxygenase [Paenibacillus alvei]|uniref:putative quinol monooxygenase n=1 Tax=Niallia sp. FSL R7-0271 TaxID=2921678 RepID=UPI0030FB79A1